MLSYETRTPFGDKPGVKMFVGSEFAEFAEVNGLQFPSSGTALGTNEYCYMIVGYDSQQNDLDTPYHKFLFPPLDKRFKEYAALKKYLPILQYLEEHNIIAYLENLNK